MDGVKVKCECGNILGQFNPVMDGLNPQGAINMKCPSCGNWCQVSGHALINEMEYREEDGAVIANNLIVPTFDEAMADLNNYTNSWKELVAKFGEENCRAMFAITARRLKDFGTTIDKFPDGAEFGIDDTLGPINITHMETIETSNPGPMLLHLAAPTERTEDPADPTTEKPSWQSKINDELIL